MVLGAPKCSEGDGVGKGDEEHLGQPSQVTRGRDLNPEERAAVPGSGGECQGRKEAEGPEVGASGGTSLPGAARHGDGWWGDCEGAGGPAEEDRKSTRLNSSHT